MKRLIVACFFSTAALASPLSIDRAWYGISDPLIMNVKVRTFANLPLKGEFADQNKKMWSGDYWPNQKGGINQRWNLPTPIGFNLISPTRDEAMRMTLEELATLAPSEKFDLLNGRYNYPLKNKIMKITFPTAQDWEGICHGWAPATMLHKEPAPKIISNIDRIQIPFGSADIKALISHYYAREHKVISTYQMGRRCQSNPTPGSDTCLNDMNAGAFHLVLTNQLGLKKESFIAELNNKPAVANHPLNSYSTSILERDLPPNNFSARGTVRMIKVKTDLKYVTETDKNTWAPVQGTAHQKYKYLTFEYFLDLDSTGKIIGGDWISEARPDFLWTMSQARPFIGGFGRLTELLND